MTLPKHDLTEILKILKKISKEAGIFIVNNYKKDLKTDLK